MKRPNPSDRTKAVLLVVGGLFLGHTLAVAGGTTNTVTTVKEVHVQDPAPPPEVQTETVTEYVVTVPDSCLKANEVASRIVGLAGKIDAEASAISDLVGTATQLIVLQDTNELVHVKDRSNAILNRTLAMQQTLHDYKQDLAEYRQLCSTDIKEGNGGE